MIPTELSESRAGTMSVPTGSTCATGLRVSRPARFAVSSPNAFATSPCDSSCKMIDGTMQQKMMISLCVMLWCATSAMRTTAPAAIHRARFVRSSIGRLPDGAPGGRT